MTTPKYRTIFISDVHLGTDLCKHEKLLAFLKSLESEDGKSYIVDKLYLNGDIIDMTSMNHKIFWSKHRTVLKKFLRMADKGVHIIYVRGNHDYHLEEVMASDYDVEFNGIKFVERDVHTTAQGKRYLVLHGDQFDGLVKMHPWLYSLGDFLYSVLIGINRLQNIVRRMFHMKEWSFSLWLKMKTKNAVKFLANFEKLIIDEAHRSKTEGIICGHLHILKDEKIGDVHYLNSGCWTEFTSCILEHEDGTLEATYI